MRITPLMANCHSWMLAVKSAPPTPSRPYWSSPSTMTLPTTGPHTVPKPPMTQAASRLMEISGLMLPGLISFWV